MRTLFAIAIAAMLAGCGLDTATSAATAASLKKQEVEQGQQDMQQAKQKINAAVQQMNQRAAADAQR